MDLGIISMNSALPAQIEKEKILGLNGKLSENGLILSEKQALSIAEARESSLLSNGRIEFSGETAEKIILEFGKSTCIDRDTFADTVCELIDIFYYLRNDYPETRLSDDRLISVMRECFDNECAGDTGLLADAVPDRLMGKRKRSPTETGSYDE